VTSASHPENRGANLRNEMLERIRIKNRKWLAFALNLVEELDPSREWTGEDIRMHIRFLMNEPSHHNVWGVMINDAIRKRLLEPTGRWVAMQTEKSHARRTPLYRVTAAEEHRRQEMELEALLGV